MFSITTTTDTKTDIITHFQINPQDDDGEALQRNIEGSRLNAAEGHKVIVADAGFASIENLEHLEEEGQMALIPDQRVKGAAHEESSPGEYDRSKFRYRDKTDCYICPQRKNLRKVGGPYTINSRPYLRYANPGACRQCARRPEYTKAPQRMIYRDRNEGLKEQMRHRLSLKRNKRIYNRRAHAAESPYGHAKQNLKLMCCMRRGTDKVKMEMALVFMLHNMIRLNVS
jgi:hypothetical protein